VHAYSTSDAPVLISLCFGSTDRGTSVETPGTNSDGPLTDSSIDASGDSYILDTPDTGPRSPSPTVRPRIDRSVTCPPRLETQVDDQYYQQGCGVSPVLADGVRKELLESVTIVVRDVERHSRSSPTSPDEDGSRQRGREERRALQRLLDQQEDERSAPGDQMTSWVQDYTSSTGAPEIERGRGRSRTRKDLALPNPPQSHRAATTGHEPIQARRRTASPRPEISSAYEPLSPPAPSYVSSLEADSSDWITIHEEQVQEQAEDQLEEERQSPESFIPPNPEDLEYEIVQGPVSEVGEDPATEPSSLTFEKQPIPSPELRPTGMTEEILGTEQSAEQIALIYGDLPSLHPWEENAPFEILGPVRVGSHYEIRTLVRGAGTFVLPERRSVTPVQTQRQPGGPPVPTNITYPKGALRPKERVYPEDLPRREYQYGPSKRPANDNPELRARLDQEDIENAGQPRNPWFSGSHWKGLNQAANDRVLADAAPAPARRPINYDWRTMERR
jgi:hypothetical protein